MALDSSPKHAKTVEDRERGIVRFAGDSGDGMPLAGTRFTDATAAMNAIRLEHGEPIVFANRRLAT